MAKGRTFWQPEIWRALTATALITLTQPENISTYSILACLPSSCVFLFANDSQRLNIQMNHSYKTHVVSCEQCMLSSCLTPPPPRPNIMFAPLWCCCEQMYALILFKSSI